MYRRYENPYELSKLLEEAKAELEKNPDDDYLWETVAELKDRLNFAWQDDEYDSDY